MNAVTYDFNTSTISDAEEFIMRGYDADGYNVNGFNHEGITHDGTDLLGYTATTEAPLNRVRGLIAQLSSAVHPEKLKTDMLGNSYRNLEAEGWTHSYTQGWVPEDADYGLEESFTHVETGTHFNPEGFSVMGINAEGISETGFDMNIGEYTSGVTEEDEHIHVGNLLIAISMLLQKSDATHIPLL